MLCVSAWDAIDLFHQNFNEMLMKFIGHTYWWEGFELALSKFSVKSETEALLRKMVSKISTIRETC